MGNNGKNNGKNVIFALAGAYLIYTGGSLLLTSVRERPDQYMLFMLAGIGFVIFGLVVLGGYLKAIFKHEKIEECTEEEMEASDEEQVIEATEEKLEIETEVATEIEMEVDTETKTEE